MPLSRRAFLASATAGLATGLAHAAPRTTLGVAYPSYSIRSRAERTQGFLDPLKFLDFCRERGAGGVQLPLGTRDSADTKQLRARVEETGLFLEGSVSAPRERTDVERFEAEVRTARSAGATVLRSVLLGGRRYETFKKAEDFKEFQERSLRALELAEPVLTRHRVRLAVENHKDYRTGELAELMRRLGSDQVGVCVDTGNNIALLDDPLETVTTLAPWAFSCHLKDMAVAESPDGFLLSEVPLGEGRLDLGRIIRVLREGRPGLRFNLEMITRDPLLVPCLQDGYWATFGGVSGRDLARTLAWVRKPARPEPLPRVSNLSPAEQLAAEDRNVRKSLAYAGEKLGLT